MADTDPDELERRIARTRAELAQTVDAITDRVNPKRVAERKVADVKSRAGHLVASVGDALGVGPRPVEHLDQAEPAWEEERPSLAPVLIGVGAVLVVGAAIVLWRRRKKRH
jgi:LPXTG-motif cell wall-anchored protein